MQTVQIRERIGIACTCAYDPILSSINQPEREWLSSWNAKENRQITGDRIFHNIALISTLISYNKPEIWKIPVGFVTLYIADVTLEKGSILTFRCTWEHGPLNKEYKWNLYGPVGWKVLLRVQTSWNLKVEAGDLHIDDTTHTGGISSGSEGVTNSHFNSAEDLYFDNTDQYLSRTNMIWIRASCNTYRCREGLLRTERFSIITRTANVTGIDFVSFIFVFGWSVGKNILPKYIRVVVGLEPWTMWSTDLMYCTHYTMTLLQTFLHCHFEYRIRKYRQSAWS